MGTTNYGNQVISIQYLDPVDSSVVNRMLQDVLPTGIYKGGKITKSTDTQVVISPLVVSISDGTYRATIRTTQDVSLDVSPSTPYVVLRWSQPAEAGHYMDFFALAKGDIQDNDLIVGKCVYSGSTLIGISYEERSYPVTAQLFCKVVPDDSPSMRVKVLDGWVSVSGEFKRVPMQYTSTVTAPSSKNRIDLVYIDPATGVVGIEAGTEADDPVPPSHNGKIPLAHLHLSPGMTEITEKEIVDVRSILAPTGVVYVTGNQTINGVKTFTSFPVTPSADPSSAYEVANKQYVDKKSYENYNIHDHIKILTGEVSHGGTIPLPSGYTQSQCKWLVSFKNGYQNREQKYENSSTGVRCWASSNRVVTAQITASDSGAWANGTANYIIIGIK